MPDKSLNVTVFLLRKDKVSVFQKEMLSGAKQLALVAPLDGVVVALAGAAEQPAWAAELESLLKTPEALNLNAQSPSALVFVNRAGRSFVLTFGHAWQKLRTEWVEPDFGRHVVLNLIKRDQLVEIRAEQVLARWHLASERAPRPASVDEFGVEFDRDLVEAVEGTPTDKVFGARIRGGTSLRAKIDMADLAAALDRAAKEFASDAYKSVWPEVDNLSPVVDQATNTQLDGALDAVLQSKGAESRVVLFTPASRRGESIAATSYVFGTLLGKPAHRPYMTFEAWRQAAAKAGKALSTDTARSIKIHLFDDDKKEIADCSTYECFGAEVPLGGNTYVLSSGTWYRAADDFVKKINSTVKKIDPPKISPPAWNGAAHEDAYNKAAATATHSLLFDEQFIHYGGGQSKFEFCDFMHEKSRTLFFAKIASRSSGMSHLLEQTRRTSELLFGLDGAYRRKLVTKFQKVHPKADVHWLDSRPNRSEWNLCLVSLGRKAADLPFFARCGLAKMVQDLRTNGYNVSFIGV
jgi:uncharacterized protein (TIGR04141 family)